MVVIISRQVCLGHVGGINWSGGLRVMDWRYGRDGERNVDIARRSAGGL